MADRDIQVEDSDLSAVVSTEIRQAQTFDQYKRTLALQYMRGEMPDIPARANGSCVVGGGYRALWFRGIRTRSRLRFARSGWLAPSLSLRQRPL